MKYTNTTGKDFDFKVDGYPYSVKKDGDITLPYRAKGYNIHGLDLFVGKDLEIDDKEDKVEAAKVEAAKVAKKTPTPKK